MTRRLEAKSSETFRRPRCSNTTVGRFDTEQLKAYFSHRVAVIALTQKDVAAWHLASSYRAAAVCPEFRAKEKSPAPRQCIDLIQMPSGRAIPIKRANSQLLSSPSSNEGK